MTYLLKDVVPVVLVWTVSLVTFQYYMLLLKAFLLADSLARLPRRCDLLTTPSA